jgi:HlyD family secretion protein
MDMILNHFSPIDDQSKEHENEEFGSFHLRILIVDDQRLFREVWTAYLESEPILKVIGTAQNGEVALEMIEQLRPDIALVDIEMPGMDGLTTTKHICDRFPETRVLVLSGHDDESYIHKALDSGARGYLLKTSAAEELTHAVRCIGQGYVQLGTGVFEQLNPPQNPKNMRDANVYSNRSKENLIQINLSEQAALALTLSEPEIQPERIDSTQTNHEITLAWKRSLLYMGTILVAIALPWSFFTKIDDTVVARGFLEPPEEATELKATLPGIVRNIYVQEGQVVKKGQSLLQFASEDLLQNLSQMQLKLASKKSLRQELEQMKRQLMIIYDDPQSRQSKMEKSVQTHPNGLHTNIILNQQTEDPFQVVLTQMNLLETEISELQAQIQTLNSQIHLKSVKATIDGTVIEMPIKSTNVSFQVGQTIARIVPQSSSLRFKAQILSQQAAHLKLGLPVKLKFDDSAVYQGFVWGHLTEIQSEKSIQENGIGNREFVNLVISVEPTQFRMNDSLKFSKTVQMGIAEVSVQQRRALDLVLDLF